jgi:hypothetical protein
VRRGGAKWSAPVGRSRGPRWSEVEDPWKAGTTGPASAVQGPRAAPVAAVAVPKTCTRCRRRCFGIRYPLPELHLCEKRAAGNGYRISGQRYRQRCGIPSTRPPAGGRIRRHAAWGEYGGTPPGGEYGGTRGAASASERAQGRIGRAAGSREAKRGDLAGEARRTASNPGEQGVPGIGVHPRENVPAPGKYTQSNVPEPPLFRYIPGRQLSTRCAVPHHASRRAPGSGDVMSEATYCCLR